MKFSRPEADVLVPQPDGRPGLTPEAALARTTHLCVGAHQDDIEVMAHGGITECYGRPDKHFTGVVVTNGAGAPRAGRYAATTDLQMQAVRREEQRRAAMIGKYNLQIQLAHPSADVKTPGQPDVVGDLRTIFAGCTPTIVYLHQPADKHDTHIGVLLRCLEALRSLPKEKRPARVVGCEVWRDLDWLDDRAKVALDSGARPDLAVELLRVFDSQVSGGKRYDLAVPGRRLANATFHTSHATDAMTAITWAVDLSPLVADETQSVVDFTLAHIERLRADVAGRLKKFGA